MSPTFTTWLVTHAGVAALAFARAAGLSWTAPALATPGLDVRFRLLLAALLGLVLVPTIEGAIIRTDITLGVMCVGEVLVGAALGWSASLVVAGARQAGEIVGAQAGFSPAALLDPEASDEMTPLGHLYGLVALGMFLVFDGPLSLVRALVESYRVIPPGGGVLGEDAAAWAFGRVGQALALSLRAAAPAALSVALAGVAIGLLGRAAPSLPLIALSMPVRAALGLVLVFLGLATLAVTLTAAWGAWPGPVAGLLGPAR